MAKFATPYVKRSATDEAFTGALVFSGSRALITTGDDPAARSMAIPRRTYHTDSFDKLNRRCLEAVLLVP